VQFTAAQKPQLYVALGTAYLVSGDLEAAAATFDLTIDCAAHQALDGLAYVQVVSGEVDAARALLEHRRASGDEPTCSLARLALDAREGRWHAVRCGIPTPAALSGSEAFTYASPRLGGHPARVAELLVAYATHQESPSVGRASDLLAAEFGYVAGHWDALAAFLATHASAEPAARPRALPSATIV
jgi:hypothetical protein